MKALALFALTFGCAFAATNQVQLQTLTIGTNVFQNVTIRKASSESAIIRHDGGFFATPSTNLPASLRAQLFDPSELADIARRKARSEDAIQASRDASLRKAQTEALLKQRQTATVRVGVVSPEGFSGTVIEIIELRERLGSSANSLQSIGARVSGGGGQISRVIGIKREEKQAVFILNGPRSASTGKEVSVDGWFKGTREIDGKTVEVWDCKMPELPQLRPPRTNSP